MKKSVYCFVVAILFGSLFIFNLVNDPLEAASAASPRSETTDRVLPSQDRAFAPAFPGNDLITFAAAYGDRSTGRHGTFGRFPANFETPPHRHTHSYRAIVLKGQMTNPFEGRRDAPVMEPGSYWAVSADSLHTTACVSEVPCEFFMFGSDSFDFKPVSE